MKLDFVDLNKNVHYIADIVRCEARREFIENVPTENIYAILRTGEEVPFLYHQYKKLLENHQKIISEQK